MPMEGTNNIAKLHCTVGLRNAYAPKGGEGEREPMRAALSQPVPEGPHGHRLRPSSLSLERARFGTYCVS